MDGGQNLPALWEHPGVKDEHRRSLAREVFEELRLREGKLVAAKPRANGIGLTPLVWFDRLTTSGEIIPLILRACEEIVIASPDEFANRGVAIWGGVHSYADPRISSQTLSLSKEMSGIMAPTKVSTYFG